VKAKATGCSCQGDGSDSNSLVSTRISDFVKSQPTSSSLAQYCTTMQPCTMMWAGATELYRGQHQLFHIPSRSLLDANLI
jgi:hypothetical protein